MIGVDSLILRLNKIHLGHCNLSFLRPLFFPVCLTKPKLASSLARQVREYRFGSPFGAEGKDDQLALEGSDFDGSAL